MFLVPHVGPACKLRIEEGRYIGSLLWDPWDGERVAEESDQGIDDATEKEVRSPVPDAESDSDPEDSVPLNKRKLTTKADTSAVTPKRVRRRLVKAHVGPVFADVSGVEPETNRPEEERTRVVADDGEKTVVGIMGEKLKGRQCNVGAPLDVVDESMPPPSRGAPEKGEKGETQLSEREEMLRVVQESVVAIETKEREAVGKFREQLELNSSLEVKLEESAGSLMGVEKTLAEMQKQNDDLRATLDSLPSRDVIISENRRCVVLACERRCGPLFSICMSFVVRVLSPAM
ncbi:hypothetical protein DCAR_0310165 [Daucus carota subsp. sativus]|uniref:Uncharacterized protein n=1 Tax=Daucus carota subsp. sativus TaxID=79200 RepID=A0A165ZN02_DAUCS|nr:hypothetical protein DCAR_0310165 [Daucus carota subsp. sativus]